MSAVQGDRRNDRESLSEAHPDLSLSGCGREMLFHSSSSCREGKQAAVTRTVPILGLSDGEIPSVATGMRNAPPLVESPFSALVDICMSELRATRSSPGENLMRTSSPEI